MQWQTLDSIVRSVLLQRGYPIHWYIDFLKYGADAVRELHFDSLKQVNSVKLPVNSYKAITLPCDYVDWVKVGIAAGQYIHPLAQGPINRLNNFDSSGSKIPYDDTLPDGSYADVQGTVAYINGFTALGEHVGGVYNHNPGRAMGAFIELRERNEIQLDSDFPYDYAILQYISDGNGSDAATYVDPYAQAAIEAYIMWKMKQHNRQYGAGEVQEAERQFAIQQRILRARRNQLSTYDVIRAFRLGYSGTYKN